MDDETFDTPAEDADGQPDANQSTPGDEPTGEAETFPRKFVEELRRESAGYRERAKVADTERGLLAARLHLALVEATGLLADPHDLPYDSKHLDDPEALTAAIEELIAAKPHLRSRTPSGDVGQGVKGNPQQPANLLAMLKSVV